MSNTMTYLEACTYMKTLGIDMISNQEEWCGTNKRYKFRCIICGNPTIRKYGSVVRRKSCYCDICATKVRARKRTEASIRKYGSFEDNCPTQAKCWDYDKNNIAPSAVSRNDNGDYWFICDKCSFSFKMSPNGIYSLNTWCPECAKKIQGLNYTKKMIEKHGSFADRNPDMINRWSSNNKETPYDVCACSSKKYLFICEIHGEFLKQLSEITLNHGWCPECCKSKGEQVIEKYLLKNNLIKISQQKYNSLDIKAQSQNNLYYISQKKFKSLIGLGGGNLSYDFYIPKYNLLVEYQGEFHDGSARMQTKKDFITQQEHDRRKREYAKEHNIDLLEIWYWDYDNIEKILGKKLKIKN